MNLQSFFDMLGKYCYLMNLYIHDIIWFIRAQIISSVWSIKSDPRSLVEWRAWVHCSILSAILLRRVTYWCDIGAWHVTQCHDSPRHAAWHLTPSFNKRTHITRRQSDWAAHQPRMLAQIRYLISILIDNACMASNLGLQRSPLRRCSH